MNRILAETKNPATHKKMKNALKKIEATARSDHVDDGENKKTGERDGDCDYEPPEAFEDALPFEDLTNCQKRVCFDFFEDFARGKQSLSLVVGGAGTGKTQCIKSIVSTLTRAGKIVGLCATSGAAAVLFCGVTLHGLCGVKIDLDWKKAKPSCQAVMGTFDCIIVDEISLATSPLLVCLDKCCRAAKGVDKPYGGINLICLGDPLQLPPVLDKKKKNSDFSLEVQTSHAGKPAWSSTCAGFKKFVLVSNKRVAGQWASILKKIRVGGKDMTDKDYKFLISRFQPLSDTTGLTQSGHVTLCARKVTVDVINQECQQVEDPASAGGGQPDSVVWRCLTTDSANFDLTDEKLLKLVDRRCTLMRELRLKVGDPVMLTRNILIKEGVVNGMMGTIEAIHARERMVEIKRLQPGPKGITDNVFALPTTDHIQFEDGGYAKRRQVPVVLCYASTVHKLQGQEFEKVVVVLDHMTDQPGQLYTALSRCKDADGLVLTHTNESKITKAALQKLIRVNVSAVRKLDKWAEELGDRPLPPDDYDPFTAIVYGRLASVDATLNPHVPPDWCSCGSCVGKASKEFQVCCGEEDCVTKTDGFAECLEEPTDDDLNNPEEQNLWPYLKPASADSMTPHQKRLVGHRKVFRLIHGVGKTGVKVVLPSCCTHRLIQQFNSYPKKDSALRSELLVQSKKKATRGSLLGSSVSSAVAGAAVVLVSTAAGSGSRRSQRQSGRPPVPPVEPSAAAAAFAVAAAASAAAAAVAAAAAIAATVSSVRYAASIAQMVLSLDTEHGTRSGGPGSAGSGNAGTRNAGQLLSCSGKKPLGIPNVKNSCFVNTSLQCIAAVLGTLDNVHVPDQLSRRRANPLPNVLRSLWCGEGTTIDPGVILADFHRHIPDMKGRGSKQQDMSVMFQAIVKDYLEGEVQKLFDFEYLSWCRCPLDRCDKESYKFDPARSLQVELHEGCNTLESLLDHHVRPGPIEWKHDCKSDVEPKPRLNGEKTLSVSSYPEILVVQLKRFKFSRDNNISTRVDTKIKYPAQLDYYRNPDQSYRLVAVGRHVGHIDNGHYFAWVRYGNDWWRCSDSLVTPIPNFSTDMDDGGRAYMLFYKRIDDGG